MTTMAKMEEEITVILRRPHEKQDEFIESPKKRKIIRAGRRGGKTLGVAILAVKAFLAGKRVLYTAPSVEQTDAFWFEVTRALRPMVEAGILKQNESERFIERLHTQNRIKAKTASNANALRGDFAELIIYDEWQLTAEDAWEDVGAPMLVDNNGDAVFIYTPPSLKSTSTSRAINPRHASEMFKAALKDPDWGTFHFTSFDNPHISREGLAEVSKDMSRDSYLKEIMAEEDEDQVNLLVYGTFNETVCKIPRSPIPSDWPVYTGHDFGQANPACLFVAQDPGTGFFYIFKEYKPSSGHSTFENVQQFKKMSLLPGEDWQDEKAKRYNIIQRVGGNLTSEDEIRQGYAAQGWPITAPYVEKVNAQIDRVKQLMEKNKIFIFEDMYELLQELNTCLWKTDEYGKRTDKVKNEAHYHLLACLRALFSIFKPETERINKPQPAVSTMGIRF